MPDQARAAFIVAVPCLVAVWALGGFYLSLGPSLASELLASQNRLLGGVVIFLLSGVGAVASVVWRAAEPSFAMFAGCLARLAGIAATLIAIVTKTADGFLVGTGVAGVGFGLAFLGALRTVTTQAAPAERAGLIAAIYVVNYLAFSVPALIAGWATTRFGPGEVQTARTSGEGTRRSAAIRLRTHPGRIM